MTYGLSKILEVPFDDAVELVKGALSDEGFGILSTIDVAETLKKKLDVDFKRYLILGACNPGFAHQALQTEENIGLMLPCNVILYEKEEKTAVSVFDPIVMTKIVDNPDITRVAGEVKERLERVVEAL